MDIKVGEGISKDLIAPLTNSITEVLVSYGRFNVVDRANRNTILEEQGFQQTGCVSESCSVEVGRIIGVNRIIIGSVNVVGGKYYINLQIINVETAAVDKVSDKTIQCTEADLLNWIKVVAANLIKGY